MGTTGTPASGVELLSLADLKSFLSLASDNTRYDEELEFARKWAISRVERYCNRNFEAADYSETYDVPEFEPHILHVKNYPVNSITSLSAGARTYTSDDYFLYSEEGKIVLKSYSFTGSSGYDNQAISISYNAGYNDGGDYPFPDVLRSQAAIIAQRYFRTMRASKDHFGDVETLAPDFELTTRVMDTDVRYALNPFRRGDHF